MTNSSRIAVGTAGALAGYVATFVLLALVDFGNRADPITSGLLGLFVYAPIGAVAGAVLGNWLAAKFGRDGSDGLLARNSLKSLGIFATLCVVGVGIYAAYSYATATPWLNRNGGTPLLLFEVRCPAGIAVPMSGQGIAVELQTDLNTMPGDLKPAAFYRDGDQTVIAGEVELAFRTAHRQLAVTIQGQPSRLFPIDLGARAPHSPDFGPWRRIPDGSEIRYRAKWPGKA